MNFNDSHYIREILDFHCPRYCELPNIDLYMDQVLSIIETSLKVFSFEENEKIITKSMINNYVKQKVIESPSKKHYKKFHVAYLIIISILKKVLSISEISIIINTQDLSCEDFYNMFCEELESALSNTFLEESNIDIKNDNINNKILIGATRAFANKVYVEKLIQFNLEENNKLEEI